jgi:transposase
VDTHLDVHVAAVLDHIGGLLGVEQFSTGPAGDRQLLEWLSGFGPVARVGVEGTGSYGAGLARHLRTQGVEVVEVDRPNRQERRRRGKTDTVDAIEAARAAQAGRQLGAPKTRDGNVEAIRALVVAKRSARDCRIKTMNQIRHLGSPPRRRSASSYTAFRASCCPARRRPCDPERAATRSCSRPKWRCAPSAGAPWRSRRRNENSRCFSVAW